MALQAIDSGATHLPTCSCGWRGSVVTDKRLAWVEAVEHGRAAHGEPRKAAAALSALERRRNNG